MEYDIHTECRECGGYGIREHQIAVDEFKESDCYECYGSGLVVHTEVYDSEDDAKADYPDSFIRPSKWNHAKEVGRSEMIASKLGNRLAISGILKTKEVAEYLRVNRHTVYRLVADGKIPAIRLSEGGKGRRVSLRFQRSDIEKFVLK